MSLMNPTSDSDPVDSELLTVSVLDEQCSFPVQDFQAAIRFYIVAYPDVIVGFWELVVREASKGKCTLGEKQAPYLKSWIKENWFWFTEPFSDRTKIKLYSRLGLLVT
jgi:hypothetical protein